MEDPLYKKIKVECSRCKTKFDIWIEDNRFSSELEERIRENFYQYCPVCRALEKINKSNN